MTLPYSTIVLEVNGNVAQITLAREGEKNSLNFKMISELHDALRSLHGRCAVVVIQGGAQYFCFGADFAATTADELAATDAIFGLLQSLHEAPLVTVCVVRGRANAGGVGLVAAADVVIAQDTSTFSLSEMLFGLLPACIYPFLVQRLGLAKARYLALTTTPICATRAQEWGLVDEVADNVALALRKRVNRLRLLSPEAICEFKRFHEDYSELVRSRREFVMDANRRSFGNTTVVNSIIRYQTTGKFPWEG